MDNNISISYPSTLTTSTPTFINPFLASNDYFSFENPVKSVQPVVFYNYVNTSMTGMLYEKNNLYKDLRNTQVVSLFKDF
jgi:hypothetical protein